jgi:AraC family transcriptional regulator
MEHSIDTIPAKKLVGMRIKMSLAANKTFELWNGFMKRRSEIMDPTGKDLYSLQVYPPGYFDNFNPAMEFEKWALAEVTDFENVPEGMETFTLPSGLYAVFIHKGPASKGPQSFQYIFGTWIPNSEYVVDDRPHFEILGEKYKHDSEDSEEELWVPVRHRSVG